MTSEQELLTLIHDCAATLAQTSADARSWMQALRCAASARKDGAMQSSLNEHRQRLQDAANEFDHEIQEIAVRLREVGGATGPSAMPWSEEGWRNQMTWERTLVPPVTRIGQLRESTLWGDLYFPALVPFITSGNLLIEASGAAKEPAVQAMQSVMLRLLATMPPAKLRFLLIDPVGLGQSVAGFMQLDRYGDDLITSRAWTEPSHIEQRLADVSAHMETVIQKYLRNQYPNMEAYNEEAGEVAEPYRVIVVANFPAAFTENAARRLVSIAANGARCGVHVLATVDTELPLPYGFSLGELERISHLVAWSQGQFVWRDPVFGQSTLTLDACPDKNIFDTVINKAGEEAQAASKVELPLAKIVDLSEPRWDEQTSEIVVAPIGRAGARKIQLLALGKDTAQHALVAGKTGSGKSTLMHVIIASLAIRYSPDELQLYLIDFKKGVEFKEYATADLPHAQVVAVESEREFGLSVLLGLDSELEHRGESFRRAGVNSIADYRRETGRVLPRILLIVDEFQEFFSEDDALASRASLLLDRLVRQGRAFGMHVLLGSQTLAGSYSLARSTIDQMAVRIALQCSDADSRLILSDDNGAARLLSRPGEAIYNAQNGLYEGNQLFQTAWLNPEQKTEVLRKLRQKAERLHRQRPEPLIVFEGNEPADIRRNRPLAELINSQRSAAGNIHPAFLGEPISIKDPTAALFRRQSGSNLLVVGQNEKGAAGVLASAFVSLLAWHRPTGPVRFVHLDFSSPEAPWSDLVMHLSDLAPKCSRFGRRRELVELMAPIYYEVQQRVRNPELPDYSEVYLFIWGMQRARDLRFDEASAYGSAFGDETEATTSPAQQLSSILTDGPDVGIHVIAWCDTYANLTRTLQRRQIGEFNLRAVFQMNAEDSSNLIDSPAASKLGPHRAYLLDDFAGTTEKFRPYDLPATDWLRTIAPQMH